MKPFFEYGKSSKILMLHFLFANKMLVISHKILVRIANSADPDQTASEEEDLFGRQFMFEILEHLQ